MKNRPRHLGATVLRGLLRSLVVGIGWLCCITPTDAQVSQPSPQELLSQDQERLASQFEQIEELFLRMSELESSTNPARSSLLQQAAKLCKQMNTKRRLSDAAGLLAKKQFTRAIEEQEAGRKALAELLVLLQSENRSDRVRQDRERIEAAIKNIQRLARIEKSLRARTENGQNLEQAAEDQENVAKQAGEIQNDLTPDDEREKNEARQREAKEVSGEKGSDESGQKPSTNNGEPSDSNESSSAEDSKDDSEVNDRQREPQEAKNQGDNKSESQSDEKSDEPKASDGTDEGSDAGQNERNSDASSNSPDSRPSGSQEDSESRDTDSSQSDSSADNSSGENSSGEGSNDEQNQSPPSREQRARDRLKQAQERMRAAEQKLREGKREEAAAEQRKAETELEEAVKELESILRQMREEEVERSLADLESRFERMLKMQNSVLNETVRLNSLVGDMRDRQLDVESNKQSIEERKILVEGQRAMLLLQEEGSSQAFPEALGQMLQDVEIVADMLGRSEVNELTITIEEEIVVALEEMLGALKEIQKNEEQKKQQQSAPNMPSQQGNEQLQPLVNALSELRLIKTLQLRVNQRTEKLSKMLSQAEGLPKARVSDLKSQLDALAQRQEAIEKVTKEIVIQTER